MNEKDFLDRVWAWRMHFAFLVGVMVIANGVSCVVSLQNASRVERLVRMQWDAEQHQQREQSRPTSTPSIEVSGGNQHVIVGNGYDARLDRMAVWTTRQAAQALGVNQDSVRRKIAEGELNAQKNANGTWRVSNPSVHD